MNGGSRWRSPPTYLDPASIDEMIDVVEDEYGRIDVLINNAAIFST